MALYETLASAYDELFPVNPATLDFLEGLAPSPSREKPARRVLDIGSATGGHALALASRGWQATGLEPSPAMNDLARKAARERGLEARFIEAGMEGLGLRFEPSSFELILCLGNTLPHLGSRPALESFLREARSLLAPGAYLVLQLLNYAKTGAGAILPEIRAGKFRFRRRYRGEAEGKRSDAERQEGLLVFETELEEEGGRVLKDETRLLAIRPALILRALGAAGFEEPRALAGWEGAAFSEEESGFLIAVARPRPDFEPSIGGGQVEEG